MSGGPEPIELTVHSLPAVQQDPRTRAGRLRMLLVLLICAAPVVASYLTFYVIRPRGGGAAYGTLIDPTVEMPALRVEDLEGRPVDLRSTIGPWLLVVADSGACSAACEKRLFLQRQLREMSGRDRDRVAKLWLVLDRETPPERLRRALDATPAMRILRIDRDAAAAWLDPQHSGRMADHLYLVDPMGRLMMSEPADPDPRMVLKDLDRLLRASAAWQKSGG